VRTSRIFGSLLTEQELYKELYEGTKTE